MSPHSARAPRITIVTPSFNQGRYLEQTIRSVLEQGYPELEYIIIDGGSTDDSVDIIRRYASELSYWKSEPDRGQAEALLKGFARASGELLGWVCSDDLLKPGMLWLAAGAFRADPQLDLLYGDTEYLYPDGSTQVKPRISYHYPSMLYAFNVVPQPSSLFTRRAYERAGGIDPSLNYAMDYDLFLRMGRDVRALHVPLVLSSYRLHAGSKTVADRERFIREWRSTRENILGRKLTLGDRARWYAYTAHVVWRFWIERGVLKLGYDTSKYEVEDS